MIFTSDNGCSPQANFAELAEKGHNPSYVFRGTKADIFDGGHHIPFIARWPGEDQSRHEQRPDYVPHGFYGDLCGDHRRKAA